MSNTFGGLGRLVGPLMGCQVPKQPNLIEGKDTLDYVHREAREF